MEIKLYSIYNLDFSYTRIIQGTEIDFKGTLSYHTIELDLLKQATRGQLEINAVNVFLSFQIQRHIDLILKDITVEEIISQRPIIINRLKTVIRRELEEIGLELVDFKRISLWGYGASDHGFHV
ncbi:MAG: hypothetical protein ACTSR2_06630 [Candidatus Hodarchaeales archaeon]